MRVKLTEHLGDLIADCVRIQKQAQVDMRATVRDGIRAGNTLAKDFAKQSAGAHGKRYPASMTTEMRPTFRGFERVWPGHSPPPRRRRVRGEYGPDIARPQGGMSFEFGSRNQKPHLDLARSADRIAPSFQAEVRRLPDKWFW